MVVWFVFTLMANGAEPSGYIPPQEVRAPECGRLGLVVGVLVDRLVNPTAVLFPDPTTVGLHCRQDISQRVAALQPGEYHAATTEMPDSQVPYIGVDPHTSLTWTRNSEPMTITGPPGKPTTIRLVP